MRTIQFQGNTYDVPDWAKWIAQDGDGEVYIFDSKPELEGFVWRLVGGKLAGRVFPVSKYDPFETVCEEIV